MNSSAAEVAVRVLVPVLLVLGGWVLQRYQRTAVRRCWDRWCALARRKTVAILLVAATCLTLRLVLLPIVPIPKMVFADEFSHWLFAETLSSGRITNPTPAGWKNIESLFILYQPTYQSKYPVGQALTLFAGKLLFGHPWFGVWLTVAAAAAATCWMLQGWVSAPWALLGGMLLALRVGIWSDWMNTYMGGALAALGGALALGAVPRLARRETIGASLALGAGIAIVMHVRPFESVMLCALVFGSVWILLSRRIRLGQRIRILAPAGGMVCLGLAGVAFQNWKITGDPLTLPYQLHKKAQGTPQGMYWQAIVAAPPMRLGRVADMYQWQLAEHQKGATFGGYLAELRTKLGKVYHFFLGQSFLLLLGCTLLVWRNPKVRMLWLALGVMMAWSSMYGYFYEHYFAPMACVCVALPMIGARYLAGLRWRQVPLGALLAASLTLSSVQAVPFRLYQVIRDPQSLDEARFRSDPRTEIERQLQPADSRHVVFVRTRQGYRAPAAYFYNGPDLERSRVIWAQEIDPSTDGQFLESYPGRQAWILDVDARSPRLEPRSPQSGGVAEGRR